MFYFAFIQSLFSLFCQVKFIDTPEIPLHFVIGMVYGALYPHLHPLTLFMGILSRSRLLDGYAVCSESLFGPCSLWNIIVTLFWGRDLCDPVQGHALPQIGKLMGHDNIFKMFIFSKSIVHFPLAIFLKYVIFLLIGT